MNAKELNHRILKRLKQNQLLLQQLPGHKSTERTSEVIFEVTSCDHLSNVTLRMVTKPERETGA